MDGNRMDQLNEETINKEKERLKNEFGVLYYVVMDILYKNDPVGICIETNTDEYEHEVIEILPRLKDIKNPDELTEIIHQFFIDEFGDIITGKKGKYSKISQEIWGAYHEKTWGK